MSLRFFILFVTLAVFGPAVRAQNGVMVGKMEGDTYVSPTGEFKVPAPVLPELGGAINDTENVVTFSDTFNTHLSIACFPLDASQKWEKETRGQRDYLLYFFNSFVLADFRSRFPGSRIESARFLPTLMAGTVITFALLPGGSYFEDKQHVLQTLAVEPVTAKRGTLLFVRHGHIYIVSSELAERATQRLTYHKTEEEEDQLLIERLTTLVSRLIFTDEKTRGP